MPAEFAAREIATIPTAAAATSFMLARTGELAGAVCGDGKLCIWALPEGRLLRTIDLERRFIDVAAISGDGRWILTGDHQGNVTVWDSSSGDTYLQLRAAPYPAAAAFSHDARLLAIAPMGGAVQVFGMETRRKLFDLERPTGGTNTMTFSRDGSLLATVDGDTMVRIYDARDGKVIARNTDFLVEPLAVEFTGDGKQVIAGGGDKVVAFIDASSGRAMRRMDRTAEPPACLALSPDGRSLMAIFMKADNLLEPAPIMVWDTATGRRRAEWLPPALPVGGGWTEDGRLLVATATKTALHIWRVH